MRRLYVRSVMFNPTRTLSLWILLASLLMGAGHQSARAQEVSAGLSPGLNAALVRLLGQHKAFSAQLRIQMTDGQGAEKLNAPMAFSILDGKMRGEIDITKTRSTEFPALAASAAKSVGMEKVVTFVRPDKAETYLLYPRFNACVAVPIDAEDIETLKRPAKLRKTPLAREVIDGHPCLKSKMEVVESGGRIHEATVWQAADLKDFPVRIQTVDGAESLELNFSHIRFERPAAKDFELPAGTTRYEDAQALSQAVMKKFIKEAISGGS